MGSSGNLRDGVRSYIIVVLVVICDTFAVDSIIADVRPIGGWD